MKTIQTFCKLLSPTLAFKKMKNKATLSNKRRKNCLTSISVALINQNIALQTSTTLQAKMVTCFLIKAPSSHKKLTRLSIHATILTAQSL